MIEFKLGNIKICFHFSFFATVALLMLIEDARYTLYGMYACLVHEFGHIAVMQLLGVKTDKLFFYAAGIKLSLKKESILPFWKDILILSGGCIINFMTFAVFFILSAGSEQLIIFSFINLLIGLFNLLPIKSFDGGRISELLIEKAFSIEKIPAAKLAVKILCAVLIVFLLFLFYVNKSRNITLYITLLYFLFSSMLL